MSERDLHAAELETTARSLACADRAMQLVEAAARRQCMQVACDTCRDPACCDDLVFISRPEARLLAAAVARLDRERRRAIRRRISRWRRARMDRLAALVTPDGRVDGTAYRARAHSCPLLEGGRCMVYAARPRACRSYVNLGDPRDCRRFAEGKIGNVITVSTETLADVELRVANAAGLRVLPQALDGPLPALLESALAGHP